MRSPMLVGRDGEIAAMLGALDRARAGEGGCYFLVGEAGAGKTRLLREVADAARRQGLVVLRGSPPAVGSPPAYAPYAQALRLHFRGRPAPSLETPFAMGLAQVVPEWPAPARPPDLSLSQLKLMVQEGFLQLLLHLGAPAVLILEDLHSADDESLELLHHLAVASAQLPILVLAAIRSGEGRTALIAARAIEALGHARVLEVGGLDREGVRRMIQEIVGQTPPDTLVGELHARTGGIPLWVEELVDVRLAAGDKSQLPPTIVELAATRLGRISEDGRVAIGAAAILGRVDHDLLRAISDRDDVSLERSLREALEAGLLELSGGELGFRHALIREAVLENLLPGERTSLHRRAAEVLKGAERASHLEAAGLLEEAAREYVQASRYSLDRQEAASAENLARRAASLDCSNDVKVSARSALAEALMLLGRWEAALAVDSEADQGPPDRVRLARMARSSTFAGRHDEAAAFIGRAAAAGAPEAPLTSLGALLALWQGRLGEARAMAAKALALAQEQGDAIGRCNALDVLGRAADAMGDRVTAAESFREWAGEAGRAGLTMHRVQALMELGNVEFMSGGSDQGLREARDLASRSAAYVSLVMADLSLVWWLGHRGLLGEAVSLGEEAVTVCKRFQLDVTHHALVAAGWAKSLIDPGSGEELLGQAQSMAPEDADTEILASWTRGDVALRLGRYKEAADLYDVGVAAMREAPSAAPPPVPFMRVCALAAAGLGKPARRALEEAERSPTVPRLYVNRPWLEVGRSLVTSSAPDFERAVAAFEQNASFDLAMALMLGAASIGGDSRARWLRSALGIFQTAGAEADAGRCRRLMRAAGLPVPRSPRRSTVPEGLAGYGLTSREAEILELVGQGLTNGEIARRLYLSVRTVESHVSALLGKVQVESRGALVAIAARRA